MAGAGVHAAVLADGHEGELLVDPATRPFHQPGAMAQCPP